MDMNNNSVDSSVGSGSYESSIPCYFEKGKPCLTITPKFSRCKQENSFHFISNSVDRLGF